MDLKSARDALDYAVLRRIVDGGNSAFGLFGTFYHLSAFESDLLPKEIARAVLRDLTDRGLCRYQRGLFTEDGELAGSGYGITSDGFEYFKQLEGGQ